MRTYDEYRYILELWEQGFNKSEIERITGIPRATARDCIKKFGTVAQLDVYLQRLEVQERNFPTLVKALRGDLEEAYSGLQEKYAYIFGLYLGDGSIVRVRQVYRLRITLDIKYPQIIESCINALAQLFPHHQVGCVHETYKGKPSCVNVSLYHKHHDKIFPQHGEGMKHTRPITLEDWQQHIIATYPLEFFRGLYHSDGSRFSNVVNGKDYPRYQFTNYSEDIRRLYCETCDRLGLHWTVKHLRKGSATDIFISKRRDVAWLDEHVGAKC
jgi:hypothetical protein